MAKRRKEKDEEEDKPFKLPKFDEEAFLKRERRNIKSTFISFLFGALMALICFGFWVLIGDNPFRWELVLLVALVNGVFLRQIFIRFRLDISDFARKNWFGSYAIYFISWLVILIVLVNPPIYDDEPPRVELMVLPDMQEAGGEVMVLAKITDNSGIEESGISFTLDGTELSSASYDYKDEVFDYRHKGPDVLTSDEDHNFELTITDVGGNSKKITGSFTFSNDAISLATPQSGANVRVADDIKFRVNTDVWRLYYVVDGGEQKINATKDPTREEFYVTSTEYNGWKPGDNITVNVTAIVTHNFENHFLKDEDGELVLDNNNEAIQLIYFNAINDTDTYHFDVVNESTLGGIESPSIDDPKARRVSAPGFEMIVLVIAVIFTALILKYKKRDRQNKK